MEPFISVIVPVYNVEKYVETCILSILGQSYQKYELIIVNDGSADNSLEICQKYQGENVVIINQEHRGLSSARNLGIRFCKGMYIAFIDSDDWIEKNYLEELVRGIDAEDIDIVQCGYARKINDAKTMYEKRFAAKKIESNEQILYEYFVNEGISTIVCAKVFRKELFERVSFKESYFYEDRIFTADLLEFVNKVNIIDKVLYNYRINRDSITKSRITEEKVLDFLYAGEYLITKSREFIQDYSMYARYDFSGRCIELYYRLVLQNEEKLNFLHQMVIDKFTENYDALEMKKLKRKKLGKIKRTLFQKNKKLTLLIFWCLKFAKIVN